VASCEVVRFHRTSFLCRRLPFACLPFDSLGIESAGQPAAGKR
jgi:hypothetical protein